MDLKDIAAISGKSGLYKVLKPTRTGVILEAIDETKAKLIANASDRVSLLKEISIYTNGKESSVPLDSVFSKIYEKFNKKSLGVDSKSGPEELKNFLSSVVPDYDTEKVYNSDIKKLVNWYSILLNHMPEVFTAEPEKEVKEVKKEAEEKKAPEKKKAAEESKAAPKAKAEAKETKAAPKKSSKSK
jgi:hypothetical protein